MNNDSKKTFRKAAIGLNIVLVILVVIVIAAFAIREHNATLTYATMMVNGDTDVKMLFNEDHKVQKVLTFDDDGEDATDDVKIRNKAIQEYFTPLARQMYDKGYVSGGVLLVTIANDDEITREAMERVLVNSFGKDSDAPPITVLVQTYDESVMPEDDKSAADGLAILKSTLKEKLPDISGIDDLSLDQLAVIAKHYESQLGNICIIGQEPSAKGLIDFEKAYDAALAHAGITEEDVLYQAYDFISKDGDLLYSLDIIAGDTEYFYEINASDGAVVSSKTDAADQSKLEEKMPDELEYISEDLAYAVIKVYGKIADSNFFARTIEVVEEKDATYYSVLAKRNSYTIRCNVEVYTGDILYYDESIF